MFLNFFSPQRTMCAFDAVDAKENVWTPVEFVIISSTVKMPVTKVLRREEGAL